MKRVAALDLGTNSFLCLIAEGGPNGIARVLSDSVQITRLGQDLQKTKKIHAEAFVRAEACFAKFRSQIDQFGVDEVLAFATSAARDATNGDELFELGRKYGIPIQIISGEDEARVTFRGAVSGLNMEDQQTMVIDIGGGSTEFVIGRGRVLSFAQSLDIGCVRSYEKFLSGYPVKQAELTALEFFIEGEIAKIGQQLLALTPEKVIAVAGTPTSLAAAEIGGFDRDRVHGFKLTQVKLEDWIKKLSQSTAEEKISKLKIEKGREDVILVGAVILLKTLKRLNFQEASVSVQGIRYGLAMELLEK